MTNNILILNLNITSYWHPGTGRGGGTNVDAVANNNEFNLPFIEGRQLKGLLRDAVNRLQQWNQLENFENPVEFLFGTRNAENKVTRDTTQQGKLHVTNATLPLAVQQWLSQTAQNAERQELFRAIYSTAIEHESGIALQKSLRGIQAVIPLTLQAEIEWVSQSPADTIEWQPLIRSVLPLIRAVGSQRSRGYGRVHITAEPSS